jgi:hypothetical protein
MNLCFYKQLGVIRSTPRHRPFKQQLHALVCTSRDLCFSLSLSPSSCSREGRQLLYVLHLASSHQNVGCMAQAAPSCRRIASASHMPGRILCREPAVLPQDRPWLCRAAVVLRCAQRWVAQPSVARLARNASAERPAPHAYGYVASARTAPAAPTSLTPRWPSLHLGRGGLRGTSIVLHRGRCQV